MSYTQYAQFFTSDNEEFVTVDNKQFYVKNFTYKNFVTIELYVNKSERNRVDKGDFLTELGVISGVFRNDISIIKPSFSIELNEPPTFNYVHIKEFNRFYYVDSIEYNNNKIYTINCSIDILMSNRFNIREQTAFIKRNEYIYNRHIPDASLMAENTNIVVDVLDGGIELSNTHTTSVDDPLFNIVITGLLERGEIANE